MRRSGFFVVVVNSALLALLGSGALSSSSRLLPVADAALPFRKKAAVAVDVGALAAKAHSGQALTKKERVQLQLAEREKYIQLRKSGADEVSDTEQAVLLRNYRLRNKKRKGILKKRSASLAEILFPGVAPVDYQSGEPMDIFVDLVDSKKTPIPYEYYDVPGLNVVEPPPLKRRGRKNLGSRLQGHDPQLAPYTLSALQNKGCTILGRAMLDNKEIRFLRLLVARQYRVQMQLDNMPILMRSPEFNYAVRGYPLGFQAPPTFEQLKAGEIYLFNHLKFIATYNQQSDGTIRIVGFDVHPFSITHDTSSVGDKAALDASTQLPTCKSDSGVVNDPSLYLAARVGGASPLPVVYSYEVVWKKSNLEWQDRYDILLLSSPDDDLHYFSIVNSLMIVLFLTGAISTIMIRTLRKDIAVYNEMDSLDDGGEETGWKLVHGDVFRPPQAGCMALSVMVGTGAQLGVAFGLSMFLAMTDLVNPVQKGQTLTTLIILYVLSGSVAGYASARIYKFFDAKAWKLNVILTATALPGAMVLAFSLLNIFLSAVGAATAVSFLTILVLFLLWVCVSAPLVFVGAFAGLRRPAIEVPTKTNQIARIVPYTPWHVQRPYTVLMGGILPFGSVCIELAFIMSALWLHQIYYVMGFLLAVLLILAATCAQVSMVLTYLQLCAEDHRWWWSSFWNCASAGGYLFAYSLWFLSSRLELVGFLPVVVYLTYMAMMSVCFGLFCGSVGFLSSFWFCRTIYGAVKVD
jgi:transmembrane 9 superfamily member 2/4